MDYSMGPSGRQEGYSIQVMKHLGLIIPEVRTNCSHILHLHLGLGKLGWWIHSGRVSWPRPKKGLRAEKRLHQMPILRSE